VLVSSRTKYISLARALARQEGCRIGSGRAGTFVARVQAQDLPAEVGARLAPLLTAIAGVTKQLVALDKALAQIVRADAVAQRLCTAPDIGPVTALTFEAVVDTVAREEDPLSQAESRDLSRERSREEPTPPSPPRPRSSRRRRQ
jgi:transposase